MGNTAPKQKQKQKQKQQGESIDSSTGDFHSNIVFFTRRDISNEYKQLKVLGQGKMGSVYSATKISMAGDNKIYAIKEAAVSKKSQHFVDCLLIEIDALKAFDHPNIVRPYAVYQTRTNVHLVFQLCGGGNLYSRYPRGPGGETIPFTEKESARIITHLLSAVAHMHANKYCHRDIKFENIMLESNHPDAEIKLIDFGTAMGNEAVMEEYVGTTYTMAREVLNKGHYTNKVDIWAVGVIAYMMISLTKPFYGQSKMIITNKIMNGDFKFYSPRWESVSGDAKDFMRALIEKDPDKRLTAVQALTHPWLKKEYPASDRTPNEEAMKRVHESIKKYAGASILKKIALSIIAHQSTTEEVRELRKAFNFFDRQKTGEISFPDFTVVMKQVNQDSPNDLIQRWFKSINIRRDGKIHYREFLAATLESCGCITDASIALAFERLVFRDGFISRQNLREILGSDYRRFKIDAMWQDKCYGDGLSLHRFISLLKDDEVISSGDSMYTHTEADDDLTSGSEIKEYDSDKLLSDEEEEEDTIVFSRFEDEAERLAADEDMWMQENLKSKTSVHSC